jgi:hypothetical protein
VRVELTDRHHDDRREVLRQLEGMPGCVRVEAAELVDVQAFCLSLDGQCCDGLAGDGPA